MEDLKQFEPLWGNWYIKQPIGEGAFGKVYRIERKEFDEIYVSALKHIKIPQSQSEVKSIMANGMEEADVINFFESSVKKLSKEFSLMSRLKGNSNIVSYEDHIIFKSKDITQWDIFIRMELLTSLIDYMQKETIDENTVIKLGMDICRALEICQKHNIIHRDIKPENIFVSENGDFKLGDFGIAKQIEKTMGGLSQKGTFTYIAPEVYKGDKYGPTVDIYSLGLVMYRLLNNNRMPFMPAYPSPITFSDVEMAKIKRLSGEKIPKPANAKDRLVGIVLKACAFDYKNRYSNPVKMRKDLEDIFSNIEENKSDCLKGNKQIVDITEKLKNENKEECKIIENNIEYDETMTMFVPKAPIQPIKDTSINELVGSKDEQGLFVEKQKNEKVSDKSAERLSNKTIAESSEIKNIISENRSIKYNETDNVSIFKDESRARKFKGTDVDINRDDFFERVKNSAPIFRDESRGSAYKSDIYTHRGETGLSKSKGIDSIPDEIFELFRNKENKKTPDPINVDNVPVSENGVNLKEVERIFKDEERFDEPDRIFKDVERLERHERIFIDIEEDIIQPPYNNGRFSKIKKHFGKK